MEYLFEKGTAADVEAVLANIGAARANSSADWDEDYPTREHIAEDVENGALYVLRAEDGAVVASVAAYDDDDEFEEESAIAGWTKAAHSVSLFRLCVSAGLQGQGIGFILMNHVLDRARARGCQTARLLASEQNGAANRLYHKLDFRSLGRVWLFDWWFIAYEKTL